MVKRDSAPFWVQLQAVAVPDDAGTPVLRMVVSDVSQQRQAAQEIERMAFTTR